MIDSFEGEYEFLSNFYRCRIVQGLITYPTAEHLYQTSKVMDAKDALTISLQLTPGQAKRVTAGMTIRPDWDEIKVNVMRRIVRAKFEQHPDLMQKLEATRPHKLLEGNNWHDTFWGVCTCETHQGGLNWLGQILMEIREGVEDEH